MKFWVKIIIAVGIVLVIGLGVWAFWFREKDEVQAYNRTAELIDYKQSLGIREKLVELRNTNYVHNESDKLIGNETDIEKSIHNFRDLCLSENIITSTGDNSHYSYFVMEKYVDELLEYYLPYTKSDKSKSKPLKALKNDIESYIRSLKDFNETLDEILDYQKRIEGNSTELEILKGYYDNMHGKYRTSLSRASDVLLSMVDYIDVCIYSDNIKLDVTFALNDAFIRSLKSATTIESILEINYAHDVKLVMDIIEKYNSNETIFNEVYSEYDFVLSYNKLYNDYKSALNYIFSCKNLEKQQMAEGVSLSQVVEGAQDHVVVALNVLGF